MSSFSFCKRQINDPELNRIDWKKEKGCQLRAADTRLITPYRSWTRADLYAVLAPVLLRWKIIRRFVCTAVVDVWLFLCYSN